MIAGAKRRDWPEVELGDVCEFAYGKSLPAKSRSGTGFPVYGSNGVVGFHDEALTDGETIVVGRKGSFGEVHFSEGPCSPIDTTYFITAAQTHAYLPWLARRLRTLGLTELNRAAAIPGLNRSDAYRQKLVLPPLPEQKRIAAILDAADNLRAKRRESLAQLDTLLQSTFLEMFGDPVTNPIGWEIESLGEICDVRDGTHDSPKYVETGHPLLTSKNFKDGQIDYEGANLISDEDFQQINRRSKVDVGDLVMPMIGTIGNPVLVEQEPDFAIKNVALIKFSKESPDNRFIRALLCSHYFDHITSKANRGGTQRFVALKDLRGMPILVPPADLQHHFATIVESVERQKTRLRAHLAELDTLFASLQSRAFNGEL
jgi:type I restriction enzyme S subunit